MDDIRKNEALKGPSSDARIEEGSFGERIVELQSDFRLGLRQHLVFETKSLLGRIFLSRRPPLCASGAQLLNLGCGARIYDGFVNADFFRFRFWSVPKNFWMLDLRYPLMCKDSYWDGAFSEHTLEHLYPSQVSALLRELHRTLKSRAWLRVAVPDLEKYVEYYKNGSRHSMFNRWRSRALAVRNVSQCHFHFSLWDVQLLVSYLEAAGFSNVKGQAPGCGSDERLLKDSREREWESLYVEGQKL